MKISGYKLFVVISILVIVAALFVGVQKRNENEALKQLHLETQAKKENIIRLKAKVLDADYSWIKKVDALTSGGANLMTFQLEQLWITPKSILFLGEIEDIQKEEKGYRIYIKNSFHERIPFIELKLSISCSTDVTEGFLSYMESHKEDFESEKPVAVFANIISVLNEKKLINQNMEDVKVGFGKCLALLPSTDNYSFQID